MKAEDVYGNAVSLTYCPCRGPAHCGTPIEAVEDLAECEYCDPCMARIARSLLERAFDACGVPRRA